ncbi:Rossmann fold domain-containing protein [Parerythrobacter aestuarii]|uniref:Rossmann fold domain-containing protein n=1 Tax=Parerythrobacter aestuarii TaxID=3020909 RepID=UPI0024DEBB9A|nr:hypothetical protein [Parerythrobacter aestuarii]
MAQAVLDCGRLPDGAAEAARVFYSDWLPKVTGALAGEVDTLAIVMNVADYDHADWRRAVAHDLARQHAPKRVNVVSGEGAALAATLAYLECAPGVTGHYLPLEQQP